MTRRVGARRSNRYACWLAGEVRPSQRQRAISQYVQNVDCSGGRSNGYPVAISACGGEHTLGLAEQGTPRRTNKVALAALCTTEASAQM